MDLLSVAWRPPLDGSYTVSAVVVATTEAMANALVPGAGTTVPNDAVGIRFAHYYNDSAPTDTGTNFSELMIKLPGEVAEVFVEPLLLAGLSVGGLALAIQKQSTNEYSIITRGGLIAAQPPQDRTFQMYEPVHWRLVGAEIMGLTPEGGNSYMQLSLQPCMTAPRTQK
jgi:hypothetical protein